MVPTIERGSPRGARAARDAKKERRGALAPRPLVMDELNYCRRIVLV